MAAPKIAVDVRDYLVATVGLTGVTIDTLEPSTDNQYAVIEYEGPPTTKCHGPSIAFDNANLQILSRHRKYETARDNIMTVKDALDGRKDVTINSTVYLYFSEISRPRLLLREEKGNVIFCWEVFVQARRD